jgi:Holliday junction DNA helicase RuvA
VLSGLAAGAIIDAIRGGHVEQLVRIPGVGKKTAERMVLELKDKLEGLGGGAVQGSVSVRAEPALSGIEQDVLSALLNLGCNRASAEAAVRKAKTAEPSSTIEPMFRKALELVR